MTSHEVNKMAAHDFRSQKLQSAYASGPRFVYWDNSLSRPTFSTARRAKLWSRERQCHDEDHRRAMEEFQERPYMEYRYPEIPRHYPGTWSVVNSDQLKQIVTRLTRPTVAHTARADDIRERQELVRRAKIKSAPAQFGRSANSGYTNRESSSYSRKTTPQRTRLSSREMSY